MLKTKRPVRVQRMPEGWWEVWGAAAAPGSRFICLLITYDEARGRETAGRWEAGGLRR
jgi:hypothetical protein